MEANRKMMIPPQILFCNEHQIEKEFRMSQLPRKLIKSQNAFRLSSIKRRLKTVSTINDGHDQK